MAFVHLVPSILRRPSNRRAGARPSRATNIVAKTNDVDGKAAKRVPPSDFADTAAASPPPADDDESTLNLSINLDEQPSRPAPKKKRKNKPNVPSLDEPLAENGTSLNDMQPQFPSDEVPLVLDPPNPQPTSDVKPVAADAEITVQDPVSRPNVADESDPLPDPIEPTETDVADPEAPAAESAAVGIKLSDEDVAASKERKAAEEAQAAKKREAAMARRAMIFERAQTAASFVGEKTGVIDLGMRTRASLEAYIDDILEVKPATDKDTTDADEDGKAKESEANAKLKLTAAKAYRSLSTAAGNQWGAKAVPAIKKASFVPDEAKSLDEKSLASAAVGFFAAVVLLPALLGGGGGDAPKQTEIKKAVNRDTLSLQKKLEEKKSAGTNADRAAERLIERRRREREENIFPKTDPVPESIMPQIDSAPATTVPATPPPAVVEVPKSVAPAVPVEPKVEEKATPEIVLSAVEKELGGKSSVYIKKASFDSLAAVPTVVLEGTSDLRKLDASATKLLALSALKASRTYGYESVVVQEVGSGYEIARAGVDVLVGDETPELRAEVKALKSKVEALSITNSEVTAKVDSLSTLISEERLNTAESISGYKAALKDAESEKQALVQELADASAEIAAIPDSKVLEERTAAAEEKTRELTQTVETLSRQVTVARDAETLAENKQVVAEKLAAAAVEEKDAAVKEADIRAEKAQLEADANLERFKQDEIKVRAAMAEEALKEVKNAREQVKAAESETERVRKEDFALLESEKKKLENIVAENAGKAEKELAATRAEAAKAVDSITKERDSLVAENAKELKGVRVDYERQLGELRGINERSAAAAQKALLDGMKSAEKLSGDKLAALEKDVAVLKQEGIKALDRAISSETANMELKDEITRVRSEKKDSEAVSAEAEKDYRREMDKMKREYAGKLDAYAKEADARLSAVREEARKSVETANAKVKEMDKSANSLDRQVRNVTKERDELKKALDKARAKNGARDTSVQEEVVPPAAESKS